MKKNDAIVTFQVFVFAALNITVNSGSGFDSGAACNRWTVFMSADDLYKSGEFSWRL